MARIIIKIEIEPDPDGKHCGDCHLAERGGWCSAFDVRLDGSIGRWDCCSECLARVAPQTHQPGAQLAVDGSPVRAAEVGGPGRHGP